MMQALREYGPVLFISVVLLFGAVAFAYYVDKVPDHTGQCIESIDTVRSCYERLTTEMVLFASRQNDTAVFVAKYIHIDTNWIDCDKLTQRMWRER